MKTREYRFFGTWQLKPESRIKNTCVFCGIRLYPISPLTEFFLQKKYIFQLQNYHSSLLKRKKVFSLIKDDGGRSAPLGWIGLSTLSTTFYYHVHVCKLNTTWKFTWLKNDLHWHLTRVIVISLSRLNSISVYLMASGWANTCVIYVSLLPS